MSVHIPAVVSGSYINCDNYVAGAQGSFNDVILRVKLTGDWIIGGSATKSIVASFVDARGRTASAVIVLPSMAVPGEENTYDIPIPAAAKQYEGDISVVLSGYDQTISDGGFQEFSGDGSKAVFTIDNVTPVPDVIFEVALDGIVIAPSEYTYDSTTGNVTFRLAPESGDTIKVTYQQRVITQITRTANCFMRVLSSDFVIVDGSELDTDIVTQINAEITALDGRVTTVEAEVSGFDADFDSKADKVSAAVSGHLAGLDANGNITDSGSKASDFLTTADIAAKANKVSGADAGVLAGLDENGDLTDSGVYADEIINAARRAADAAVITELALMATEASILATDASDYNNKLAYSTNTYKIFSSYQNAWHEVTATMLKKENVYIHVPTNYIYFFNGTKLIEASYLRRIAGAVNNFVSFSGGGISDSGFSASSFAAASHSHTQSDVTGLSDALADKPEVILQLDYIQDETPENYDEGEYWFAPSDAKLYFATYTAGSGYAWEDVTEEKLKPNNIFITGNGQVYYSPSEDDLYTAKAVPTAHSHTVSDISNFSSGISGKADKVSAAVSGHFAGLDHSGNLTDSGKKASDFAAASHTHTKSQITDLGLPTPTAADEGKFLKVDYEGNFYFGGPKSAYTISVSGQGGSSEVCYVADDTSTLKHYNNADSFGIGDGKTITCYVYFANSGNWIKLNGEYVANPDSGAAEYTFAPTGDCTVTLESSPGSYGHISITMS